MKSKTDPKWIQLFTERLLYIRKILSGFNGEPLTQSDLARETGLLQNAIWRMENQGGISLESLFRLLNYYSTKGINLNWLFTEDNSTIEVFQNKNHQFTSEQLMDFLSKIENIQETRTNETAKTIAEFKSFLVDQNIDSEN